MEISSYNPVLSLTTKKQHDKLKLFFISYLNLILLRQIIPGKAIARNRRPSKFWWSEVCDSRNNRGCKKTDHQDKGDFCFAWHPNFYWKCTGMMGLIEEVYAALQRQSDDPWLRDMSIYTICKIESIEMASFQMLLLASLKLKTRTLNSWSRKILTRQKKIKHYY